MKKSVKVLYITLCIVLVIAFLFAGFKLIQGELGYFLSRRAYEKLSNTFVHTSTQTTSTDNSNIELDPETSPIEVDFESLKSECSDITGWIYCPNTIINYPVVQFDDNSWYLNHRYDGQWSSSGTLFVDCTNMPEFANNNTIIYGHHMNDGSMFAKLVDYTYQSYYDAHPIMYLNTPTYNYRLEIFAGYVTKSDDKTTYRFTFENDDDQQKFIDYALENSTFKSNVDIKPGDKILTLSTCTYDYDDARYVIHAKMVAIH